MSNPLYDIVSQRARTITYMVFAVVGLIIGSAQVGFAAAEVGQPVGLVVALAIYAYLGGAIGATAASNPTDPYLDGREA